jgi:hypothetical protein
MSYSHQLVYYLFFFSVGFSLSACKNTDYNLPECKGLQVEVKRFEQDLMNLDLQNPQPGLEALYQEYGEFYSVYSGDFRGKQFDSMRSEAAREALISYLQFGPTMDLFADAEEAVPDFNTYVSQIEDALCRITNAFPELPKQYKLITYIEEPHIIPDPQRLHGVNRMNDSVYTIGLHRYLGEDYEYYTYPGVNVFQYQLHRMEPDFIPITFVQFFYDKHFRNYSKEQNTLLFNMIEEGKKYYFIQRVLPNAEPYMIIGYTKEDWDLSILFEYYIWKTFIENDLLYSNSLEEIKWYIGEAPHSKRMDDRLPGNIGSFIGWRIVESYAKNQSNEPGLAELVDLEPETIFLGARYDPEAPDSNPQRSAWIIRIVAGVLILSVIVWLIWRRRKSKA